MFGCTCRSIDLSHLPVGRARSGGGSNRDRGRAPSLRSERGAAISRAPGSMRRGLPPDLSHIAPSGIRWCVHISCVDFGAGRAVQRLFRRPAVATSRTRRPISAITPRGSSTVWPAALTPPKWNTGARRFPKICRCWSCPPTGRVPPSPPGGVRWKRARIPAPLLEALKELGRSEGLTPYMMLLAVFQVLLYRYSGQDDIIVGGATNTRTRPEFEPLIGYFLNAVVFRSSRRRPIFHSASFWDASKAPCWARWPTARFPSTPSCANWRPSATPAVTLCSRFYSRCGRPSTIFRKAGTSPTWRSTAARPLSIFSSSFRSTRMAWRDASCTAPTFSIAPRSCAC